MEEIAFGVGASLRSAFDVFLMARYEQEFDNKDSLCLGMFDDRGPLGAVIL